MTLDTTITPQELAELKVRLEDAENHRKGLLEHSHNLEFLLRQAETHRAGLLEHANNLETMLREKDSDLKQTKQMLALLEARCYRYEQMLLDFGVDCIESES